LLESADVILHVGDFTTAAFLDELRSFGPVEGVYGNMDEPALRAVLSERLVVEVGGLQVGLLHDPGPAGGRYERLLAAFPECDVVAYGHTHMPEVSRAGDVWILNPGSPTERRRAPAHSMIVLDDRAPRLVALDP
jgi:putative phosphoesterase